jgi:hypothetical protein
MRKWIQLHTCTHNELYRDESVTEAKVSELIAECSDEINLDEDDEDDDDDDDDDDDEEDDSEAEAEFEDEEKGSSSPKMQIISSVLENTLVHDLTQDENFEAFQKLLNHYHSETSVDVNIIPQLTNYIFLGKNISFLEVTEMGIVKGSPLYGEQVLDTLNVSGCNVLKTTKQLGWLSSAAIDDLTSMMNHNDQGKKYYGVDILKHLIENEEQSFQIDDDTVKVFFPTLFHNHYTLRIINMTQGIIYFYDSFGEPENDQLFDDVMRILRQSAKKCRVEIPEDFRSVVPKCPKQRNTRDCGIYTILNMLHPEAGQNEGTLLYDYDDSYREYIRQSLQKYKISEELIEKITQNT